MDEPAAPLKRLVIYHGPGCADGLAAAWIARQQFAGDENDGNSTEFVQLQPNDAPPDVTGKVVYVLDLSFPKDLTLAIVDKAAMLVVLDHHKTAIRNFEGLVDGPNFKLVSSKFAVWFNPAMCGARLTWQFFCPNQAPPWWLGYIEDRDLWKWELPNSREFSAYLRSLPFTFDTVDSINAFWSMPSHIITAGKAILRYQAQLLDIICQRVEQKRFAGHIVPVCYSNVLISEVGERLCAGRPFAVVISVSHDFITYSLRSDEAGLDVEAIAKMHGGGGHEHASGFRIGIARSPDGTIFAARELSDKDRQTLVSHFETIGKGLPKEE